MNFFTFTQPYDNKRPITINMDLVRGFYPHPKGGTAFDFDDDYTVIVNETYGEVLTEIRKKE